MDLLFRREQTSGRLARVSFKLWGKLELTPEEQGLVNRYRFDEAILIAAIQPGLWRRAILLGGVAFIVSILVLGRFMGTGLSATLSLLPALAAGYWYVNEKRETIYVRDLLHGRHFTCDTVIELAKKEAWLAHLVHFLRQVMESAKHWDGTERYTIMPLPPEEAREVILRGA
jgi:hypothetical protein